MNMFWNIKYITVAPSFEYVYERVMQNTNSLFGKRYIYISDVGGHMRQSTDLYLFNIESLFR